MIKYRFIKRTAFMSLAAAMAAVGPLVSSPAAVIGAGSYGTGPWWWESGAQSAPLRQTIPPPAHVIYVHPDSGSDSSDGGPGSPLRTVDEALSRVQPGWHIRLRDGIYEENLETERAGTADAPIVIEPDGDAQPVFDGGSGDRNAIRLVHDYYIVHGLEFRGSRQGVRIEGATGVMLLNNHIHHVDKECVRVRFGSHRNVIQGNRIHDCGLDGNGEGIYIGTAPEQRYKNGGKADPNTENQILDNELYRVTEGVDVKEDSSFNIIARNHIHDASEEGSGGINIRADSNYIYDNLSEDNEGSGIRIGGDTTDNPVHGDDYHYGVNNILRNNRAINNEGWGYKLMNGPQDFDDSNTASGNDDGILRPW